MTSFRFLRITHGLRDLVRVRSGDTRRAAQRPLVSTPVPVLPDFRQVCPTAISTRTRHLRRLAPKKLQWRSTCTGQRTKRRTRRLPGSEMLLASRDRCMHFEECMRTSFPSSATPGHPLSPVRRPAGEETPTGPRTDRGLRSDGVPRRIPPSRRPGCLSPFASARPSRWIAPLRLPASGLSLTPPTRSPQVGERCLHGPCKLHGTVTRDPWCSRDERLWYPLDSSCLGLTTQARQRGSDGVVVCGD